MADTIVKSFVIDTTESEQNLKELNTQIKATTATINSASQSFNLDTKESEQNLEGLNAQVKELGDELKQIPNDIPKDTIPADLVPPEAITNTKSLRAQLRELQQQLAATEPDSAKYVELSQAAGELRDKIGDAAEAVGTQAGSAFERVGNSLGLVTGRLQNLDFAGAAEGAKLFATNITSIKFGDITSGIKSLGSTLVSVGKALLTNPIFLIGAALAIAIDYTSQFITGLDGISEVDQKNLEIQKEKAALAKQQLDAIGQQEETLKRQGLSEKQIADLKLQALDTAILEQQVVLETTKTQAAAQIAAAERNFNYLKGFLDFVTLPQKKLTEFFFNFYNGAVDLLNKLGLGIEKVDVGKIVAGFDDVTTFLTKKIFDPEETRKEGQKVIQESEATLRQLTNQRDGILNAQDAKEKATAQKAADDKIKAEQQTAAELEKIRQQELDNELKRINELAAARKKANEDRIAEEDAQFALLQELTLTDQQKEIQAAVKLAEDRLKIAGDDAALQKLVTDQREKDIADIIAKYKGQTTTSNAQSNSQQLQDDQNLYAAKLQAVSDSFGAIASLATAFGKGDEARAKKAFKIQKAASIAQATVDTYKGAQGVFANAAINPSTILFPAQPYIQAALAVAAGLVNVKNIASQQFQSTTPPSNDSPPPPSVGGGGGNESQPAQFNPLAAQFIQNQPEQITPRAFVLAGDVSSQQEVREKVQDLARLG
jgi:hypothetical protein